MSAPKPFGVAAEIASSTMVEDPKPITPRMVELHAFRGHTVGKKRIPLCLTLEVHDPLDEGKQRSLLLHFDAEKLMAAMAKALIDADA